MSRGRTAVWMHRYVGLASSMVLAIVGTTGALLLWEGSTWLHRAAGPIHERLAFGRVGNWVVVGAAGLGVVLQITGLVLWWKRKSISVRMRSGWIAVLTDSHHSIGALGLPLMLVLAITGVGLAFVTPDEFPGLRDLLMDLHTARDLPTPIKWVYVIGTLGFLVQGATGVVMWARTTIGRNRLDAVARRRSGRQVGRNNAAVNGPLD